MASNGYVYVLLNPSIQGIVKIGMTTRDPENRVAELSNATGVATPFILVYKEYFDDCYVAEKQLHAYLEQKNYRVSNNREFFSIPVHDAIKLIQDLKSQQHSLSSNEEEIYFDNSVNDFNELAANVLEEAESYYYGLDGKLEDYDEALKLFRQAAKLGAKKAYKFLGDIYQYGFGVKEDTKIAMDYYKLGANSGVADCYGSMAIIFTMKDAYKHKENANKCWASYFENISKSDLKSLYIVEYVSLYLENNWEILNSHELTNYKKIIILDCEKRIIRYKSQQSDDFTKYTIKKFERVITYFEPLKERHNISSSNGEGIVDCVFNIEDQPVLLMEIHKGEFVVGNNILIQGGITNLKTRIKQIQIKVKNANSAVKNDIVRMTIEGKFENYIHIENGWIVAII